MKRTHARIFGAAALAILVGEGVLIAACASPPDTSRVTQIYTPDNAFVTFAGGGALVGPDAVLAQRCGTLDCHGSIGRPLRIFSADGLRLVDEAGNIPGGAPETQDEKFANFTAAISVQPELTSEVFAGNFDPHVLLLLRKPLGLERHKGGQVSQGGDYIDQCLTSWLSSGNGSGTGTNYTACLNAASVP